MGIGCKITRLTTAGDIYAGGGSLHWLIGQNSAGNAYYFILNDAASGTSGDVAKFVVPANETKVWSFNPPIPFTTGIRIGTIESTNIYVTGGYSTR